MPKPIPGAPAKPTLSAKEQRQLELTKCEHELAALMDRYDAQLIGGLIMQVNPDGTPRYRFSVSVASRS